MSTTATVVTVIAAAMAGFSAYAALSRAQWVIDSFIAYRVPQAWWMPLGLAKAAGAVGLLVGLFVPVIGILAAIGLILYFAGAVITVIRARSYGHIPFPLVYMAPVVGALALGFPA
ncbi:DoxX family protein [Streptomyces sp. NPDC002073]|uniref:DoxX family protein n=1 Tax=Streptomyces sp. NBC_00239 TaxID=2903640 RepID=UPI002E29930E|nr:DoxX family protein [Streptomyces sp. NBC_00239]